MLSPCCTVRPSPYDDGVIETIVSLLMRAYRPILLVSLVLALVSVGLLIKPGLHEDYTIQSLIAADDEEYRRYIRFSETFVSGEIASFAMDLGDPLAPANIELIHDMVETCRQIEGVDTLLAISELPDMGLNALFLPGARQTVYERIMADAFASEAIAAQLEDNPLVTGMLVGRDPNGGLNTTVGIVVQVQAEEEGRRRKIVADALRAVADEARAKRPDATILLGGPLIGLIEIFEAIHRDMAVFTVVVFALICVALWMIFRRLAPLLVALTAAGLSVLCVLGFSVVTRMPTSLVSQTVVILVIVLGVSMCVHLLVAHNETRLHRQGKARGPLHDARQTLTRMVLPCAIVTTTTVLGFASLFISTLNPVKQLATLVILGIVWALLLGLSAMPGMATLAARKPPQDLEAGWLPAALSRISDVAGSGRRWPVVISVAFGVLIVFCLFKVPYALTNFEADFVKNFREDSNVRRVYRFVCENLGPVGNLEVVVRREDDGPILGESAAAAIEAGRLSARQRREHEQDPALAQRAMLTGIRRQIRAQVNASQDGVDLMRAIDAFQQRAVESPDLPVRKALSLVDLVKLASVGRLLGLPVFQLPTFEWQFALTMVLIDQNLSDDLLRNFISADGKALRINLRALESDDVYNKLRVVDRIREMAGETFGPEYEIEVTGLYPLYAHIAHGLLSDQLRTFTLALALIVVCMCVGLRSVPLGMLSMIPNLMPMILCLGIMGWADIPINMATAMMLSVALGIAVDNTIHYLWRFRRELEVDDDYVAAIGRTHRTVGRACVFNSIVIVGGFWVLCLSNFIPTVYFGMMVGMTMIGALAGDVVLLPMLLVLLRPVPVKRFQV